MADDWRNTDGSAGSQTGTAGDVWNQLKGGASNAMNSLGLGAPDLSGINAASADAKALEQQFLAQMGQSQGVPTLVTPQGAAPAGGDIWGGQSQPAPAASPAPALPPPAAPAAPQNPTQPMGNMATMPPPMPASAPAPGPAHLPPGSLPTSGSGLPPNLAGGLATSGNSPMGPATLPPSAQGAAGLSTTAGGPITAAGLGAGPPTASVTNPGLTQQQQDQNLLKAKAAMDAMTAAKAQVGTGLAGGGATAAGGVPSSIVANPTAPGMDTSQEAQFRAGQVGLAQNLADVINGKTPSVAQMQMQQAFQQQQAQQLGMAAAMGRGGNQALAMRAAMNNTGNLGAQQASASAIQRAQEQAAARGQMGDVLNSGRAGDIGIAGANQQSQIGTRGQNIQQTQNQAGNVLAANQNEQTGYGTAFNAANQNRQTNASLLSAGAGALAMLSDERAKTSIKEEPTDDLRAFLQQINPVSYRYKMSPKDSKVGVIAQDVERSKVGQTMVRDTPAGKAIDIPSATGAMLAAMADLHRRVSAVEGNRKPQDIRRGGGSSFTVDKAA